MKCSKMLLAVLLALPLRLVAQEPACPLTFDYEVFDFGQVLEDGGTLFHSFPFINGAATPVRISDVAAGCNCISVSYPQSVLSPGESGIVSVAFNPVGLNGKAVREIEVSFSDGSPGKVLKVSAEIVPSEYDIKDAFKVVLPDGLRLESLSRQFGYVPVGKSSEMHLAMLNDSDGPIRVEAEVADPGSFLSVACPTSLAPGEAGAIILRYRVPSSGYGLHEDEVRLFVNGSPSGTPLSVSSVAVDSFTSSDGTMPVMRIHPSRLEVRKMPFQKNFSASFEITNDGEADLVIRKSEASEGAVTNLPDGTVIKPGRNRKVSVHSTEPAFSIGVVANDPVLPYKELRTE